MIQLAQMQLDLDLFRGQAGSAWSFLADARFWGVVIAIVAPCLAAAAIADLIRRDRRRGGPAARTLARAIGLDRRERRLLDHLARQMHLPSAACLMISRGCFDHAVNLAPTLQAKPALTRLRHRLFDDAVHSEHDDHTGSPRPHRPAGCAGAADARRELRSDFDVAGFRK